MLSQLKEFIKLKTYTLRFSILSIFVVFLCISMMSLIGLMYIRATNNITQFAFDMMNQISSNIFEHMDNTFKNVEYKNRSVAKVIASGVINFNTHNNTEMIHYSKNILEDEANLFPILKKFVWSDNKGNLVLASKNTNGQISLETLYHYNHKTYHRFLYDNPTNDSFKIVDKLEKDVDPTLRFWYLEAAEKRKTVWIDVYEYYFSHELGISVVTPAIAKNGMILGVIKFDISLDFLKKLVENAKFSNNGIVFIVTKSGELIAFPGISQDKQRKIMTIQQLPNYPWIISSYNYFKETGKLSFLFENDNQQYLASYTPLVKIGNSEWFVSIVAPKDDFIYSLRHTRQVSMLIGLIILLCSIFIVSSIISHIVKPMKKITYEIDKIKNFELTHSPKIGSRIKEINAMGSALYAMKKGLRSFQKYIPSSLVRDLVEAGEEAQTGGVKKQLAVLFTDIHNFTSIAESTDPQLLALRICDYFDILTAIIINQHGTIDKYIGDSIMAFWGAPLDVEEPCHKAARAALLCISKLNIINDTWRKENKPEFYTTIGINFGETVVGNFGSHERLSYTAFGDTVNLASRLQDINRYFDTKIIVSQHVYDVIKEDFVLRMIDCVAVKGKEEIINIYELIGDDINKINYDISSYRRIFNKGFLAYKNRHWDKAITHFTECLSIYTEDAVSPLFIARCKKYKLHPPSTNWQGEWHIDKKPFR